MTDNGWLSVDTDTVVTAGNHTADTAGAWGSWANRCADAFMEGTQSMRSGRIQLAEDIFGAAVVLGARQVGQRVETLGTGAATAGVVVENTDVEAATALDSQATEDLRRRITGMGDRRLPT